MTEDANRTSLVRREIVWPLLVFLISIVCLTLLVLSQTHRNLNDGLGRVVASVIGVESIAEQNARSLVELTKALQEHTDRIFLLELDSTIAMSAHRRETTLLRQEIHLSELELSSVNVELHIARSELRDVQEVNAQLQLANIDAVDRIDKMRSVFERNMASLTARSMALVNRMRNRTASVATANVGSMLGEAIPFYGVGIIVAATSYEVYSSCETMRELHEISLMLSSEQDDADVSRVCGLVIPTAEEIWQIIKASPSTAWALASDALAAAGEGLRNADPPDFSGWWSGFLELLPVR